MCWEGVTVSVWGWVTFGGARGGGRYGVCTIVCLCMTVCV